MALILIARNMPYDGVIADQAGGRSDFSTVQDALIYGNSRTPSATNPWSFQVQPGTYDENLTLYNYVNLKGAAPSGACLVVKTDATNPVVTSAVTCTLEDLTIGNGSAAQAAVKVTAGTLTLKGCTIYGTGAGDAIQMTGGTLVLEGCTVSVGNVDLSTGACTLTATATRFNDNIDTASAVAHAITLLTCDLASSDIPSTASGATTLTMVNCGRVGTVSNAGTGAFTIANSNTGAITNSSTAVMTITDSSLGAVTQAAAAGTIDITNSSMAAISTGVAGTVRLNGGCIFTDIAANAGTLTWKVDPNHIKVVAGTANMKIANALALAATGDVIQIMPGTYAESNLTLIAGVNLVGTDHNQCIIEVADAGQAILNAGVTCTVSNLTISNTNAGHPAIEVTADTLTVLNCIVKGFGAGNAIAMLAGTLALEGCTVSIGNTNLSTTGCTLTATATKFNDDIDTASAVAHSMTFLGCDFTSSNIASAATLAATLTLVNCGRVGTVTNAGTGTFTIRDSDVQAINATATGTFVIYGGFVNSITRAAASVVWWQDEHTLKVLPSGTTTDAVIGYAITAASAGNVVLIHSGTYTEVITCKAGVGIRGVGPRGSVIIEQTDANIITLATTVEIDNLTIRLNTPVAGRSLILDNAVACTCTLRNLNFVITTPAALAHRVFNFTGAGTYVIKGCYYNIGGTGATFGVLNATAAATIHVEGNDFTLTNVNAFHVSSSIAGTWTGGSNRWAGTCGMFSVTLGTITFDGDTVASTAISTVTGGTVLLKKGINWYETFPGMAIQHALTAGAAGRVTIHAGAYAPTADLTVSANTLVEGDGFATIVTSTGVAIANGWVLNGNNITMKNMKLMLAADAGAAPNRPNVVYATGRTLLWLENLWIIGDNSVADDGSNARQNGICFSTVTESKIVNCRSEDNRRSGIILFTSSNNNIVTGNICHGNTTNGINLITTCVNNTVTGNTCQGNTTNGITVNDSSNNNTLAGNTCQGNTFCGINIVNTSNYNTVTGNTCQGNGSYGISVLSSYNTFTGNTCQGNSNHGIFVDRSSYCVVSGNSCLGNIGGAVDGINVAGSGAVNADYNTLTGNVCTGNGDDGIEVAGGVLANKNIVVGNQLLGNAGTPLVDSGTATEIAHNITA